MPSTIPHVAEDQKVQLQNSKKANSVKN